MMKRPRSFISTLIVFLSLMAVPVGLTMNSHDATAGGMPRVMDPRAGDPTEPSDGILPDNTTIDPGEPDFETARHIHPSLITPTTWAGHARSFLTRLMSFLPKSSERR